MRARLDPRRLGGELVGLIIIAIALTALKPMTILADETAGARLIYWVRTIFIGYLIHRPLVWLGAKLALQAKHHEAIGWFSGLAVASVPMALWLWYFGPVTDLKRPFPSDALWAETAGQVLIISLLTFACLWFLEDHIGGTDAQAGPRPVEAAISDTAPERPTARPPLMDRLPGWTNARLYALEGEDHYVRVHTDLGQHLVLIRLADAIAQAHPIQGIQVHRSWWVAKDAIESLAASGRDHRITLVSGVTVPIARKRVAQVRQALSN